MIRAALCMAGKDLRLIVLRGGGLMQALLLGLLLLFLFSLARAPGQEFSPQAAAAVFWLASLFTQVLLCNALYSLEEVNNARMGLLLTPAPPQAVWLGKGLAGLVLLLAAQAVFVPAMVVFLGRGLEGAVWQGLVALVLVDFGLMALGSLLGAMAQGQAGRESLLSVILFPLLVPVLLAGVRLGAGALDPGAMDPPMAWIGLACGFDALFAAAGLILFPFVFSTGD